MKIDELSTKDRVKFGKEKESLVIDILNRNGYNLVPSSFNEDCKDKIDCWSIEGNDRFPCSIKTRTSKDDILVCLCDPFYGLNDKRNVIGRDFKMTYRYYISLSKDEKMIRVANGYKIYQICQEMRNDFKKRTTEVDMTTQSCPCLLYYLEDNSGQLWLHKDRWNNHHKILAFIPPKSLEKDCSFIAI